MQNDPTSVGERIRTRRTRLDLSQTDLSRKTGIPFETISRIENGHRYPSAAALILLCRAMGIAASEILDT
jgi:transcriptional regulator with XRE-family HTH domain